MADTGSDARSGIGARLRAGREKMGLTQLQAAEKLHVDPKVVESLEAERFDQLGAVVFVRGHLKHYAELIGEPSGELLDLYAAATKPVLPDLTRLPKAAPDSNPSRLAVPALVVLIAFVLIGVVWWVVKSLGGPEAANKPKRGPQPVSIAETIEQDPAAVESVDGGAPVPNVGAAADGSAASGARNGAGGASSRDGTSRASGPGATAGASSAAAQSAGAGSRPTTASGGASAGTAARTAPATSNGATAAAGSSASGATSATPAGTPAATRGKPLEVTLRFAADSWVEVYDANGEKLFYDVGTAASSRTISGTPPFRVTVANAPGVSLDVNGKPATVPANALKGAEAHFTISRTGRIARVTSQADGG